MLPKIHKKRIVKSTFNGKTKNTLLIPLAIIASSAIVSVGSHSALLAESKTSQDIKIGRVSLSNSYSTSGTTLPIEDLRIGETVSRCIEVASEGKIGDTISYSRDPLGPANLADHINSKVTIYTKPLSITDPIAKDCTGTAFDSVTTSKPNQELTEKAMSAKEEENKIPIEETKTTLLYKIEYSIPETAPQELHTKDNNLNSQITFTLNSKH